MKKYILFIVGIFLIFSLKAQQNSKGWQDYLSYNNASKIAISNNKVYCVTGGGLYYFDLEDNSINKLTGSDGLSDFGISTIAYSEENKVLIIAYLNSNIDLIYESGTINLSDIKRKQITGDKNINNISFYENEAYLACGFGMVVINLDRNEIKDTYLIGEGGTALCVNDVEVLNSFIYAATEEGLYRADINNSNLLDYKNWSKITAIPHSEENFGFLAVYEGKLIASYNPVTSGDPDVLYRLNGEEWNSYLTQINNVRDIQVQGNYLVVANRFRTYIVENNSVIGDLKDYNLNGQIVTEAMSLSAGIDKNGTVWIADFLSGLIHVNGETFETVYPNGPMDNQVSLLYSNGNDLWVTPGGRSSAWLNAWMTPHFQLFRNGEWKSFSKNDYPDFDNFFDIVNIVADPKDADHIFVASWGGGLLEFQGDELLNRYTNQNSPLETALPTDPEAPFVRIDGLAFDTENNLWIINSEVANNLLKLTPEGDWESFTLPEVATNRNIGQIIITQNEDKWILVPRGHDAYVVNKSVTQKKRLLVTAYFNNGTYEEFNRMNDVYSIAEDREGEIWIGTSKGVAVYSNPSRIWDTNEFYAVQPSLDLNNGLFNPLLETETVTAIAVDGANRKWLGTQNSGVYLVSKSGEEEIMHFTAENSPLLSNTITSIAIIEKTGEIFFGTDQGLISYQGNATGGNDIFKDVYVYPNPVRETYDGDVTITGLIENTDIKITDISGNLVHHSQSLGGQAIWDGRNLNGNRVQTGVYLVFCTDESGEETHITKLLFIH